MNNSIHPVRVVVQIATHVAQLPDADSFQEWVNCAIKMAGQPVPDKACVTLRIVDKAEISALNQKYRNTAKATNVLAFPAARSDLFCRDDVENELGDIVICAEVILREAREQSKTIAGHYAHMTVHGSLHLLGHDHMTDEDAIEMETLEIRVMGKLGFPDPYSEDNQDLIRA